MIFAHIDEKSKKIKMISIPRDLFYNGRKINAFAAMYGLPELKKTLSEMTGYRLDKYIVLEMYAFIDVVDLIGGIDVHLDKALVDPTYVVIDNGVKGTLNYAPGDYHLGGKEALRIARSRHTSSDFARAERQQLILKALQQKARNLGLSDSGTVYEIIKTVLARTETDISLEEAVAYFFKYQNYTIASNAVISSGNILYTPPYIEEGDCNAQVAAAQKAGTPIPDCLNANHLYSLVPKDNNWDLVKWFFQDQFR